MDTATGLGTRFSMGFCLDKVVESEFGFAFQPFVDFTWLSFAVVFNTLKCLRSQHQPEIGVSEWRVLACVFGDSAKQASFSFRVFIAWTQSVQWMQTHLWHFVSLTGMQNRNDSITVCSNSFWTCCQSCVKFLPSNETVWWEYLTLPGCISVYSLCLIFAKCTKNMSVMFSTFLTRRKYFFLKNFSYTSLLFTLCYSHLTLGNK